MKYFLKSKVQEIPGPSKLSCLQGSETMNLMEFCDRYARSSTELILEISELIKKGVFFYSYSEILDFSTATGKLHFQILSAFAEFERSLISERTKEGIYRARSTGKTLGRPKGSKDKVRRRKSGYLLRMVRERQEVDRAQGSTVQLNHT